MPEVTPGLRARPSLRDGVSLVAVGPEAVLYREEDGELLRLDPIARLVCEYFDGETTLDQAVTELARASGESPERIRSDVTSLIRELHGEGMLALSGDSDGD